MKYIYILFNVAGDVLYVGQTARIKRRISEHRRKSWGSHIHKIDTMEVDDGKAPSIEKKLIAELTPIHNIIAVQEQRLTLDDVEHHYGMRLIDAIGEFGYRSTALARWKAKGFPPSAQARAWKHGVRPYRSQHKA